MTLKLNQQAGIIYLLFLSIVNVNCCGLCGDGGGGDGGGGGNGGGGRGIFEMTERMSQAGGGAGGGSDRNVHTPGKATVVEMEAPKTQRIEVGYNGKIESAGGNEHTRTKEVGQNKQNEQKLMWGKIAESLGFGGPAPVIASNPAAAGHRGNHSPTRGRRR